MERTRRSGLLLMVTAGWLLAACPAAPAASQDPSDADRATLLQPGARVHVYPVGGGDEWEGIFVGADETSLRIRGEDDVVTVKRRAIGRIDVATAGPRPGNAKRVVIGAAIGAGAGLSAGGMAAYVLAGGVSGDPNYDATRPILVGVAVGAAVGALIAHATRGRGWTEVPLDRVRVSVLPTRRRGVNVALAIRF